MAINIPTTEPTSARIGDTWQWRREDLAADFPAGTWSLTYHFRNASNHFDVAAAADGAAYAITVAKAVTAALSPGNYDWLAVVESATERYEADAGRITLQPNLATAFNHDARSFSRQMLEAIESALLSRASSDQLDLINATLADRSIARDKAGLITLRSQFKAEVQAEDNRDRIKNGGRSRNRLVAVL